MNQQAVTKSLDNALSHIHQAKRGVEGRSTPNINTKAMIARVNATLFEGAMTQTQRQCLMGFSLVYAMLNMLGVLVPIAYLAYTLATTYHETGRTMAPIEEWGKGEGRPYGEPHPDTGHTYYGRGYVQLTWIDNYIKASETVFNRDWQKGSVDFVNQPNLAMTPFYAAQIAVGGMMRGWFTARSSVTILLLMGHTTTSMPDGSSTAPIKRTPSPLMRWSLKRRCILVLVKTSSAVA